jgi:hypothetical protein
VAKSVSLEGDKADQCADDIERVLRCIPELSKLARVKMNVFPGVEEAMKRLGKLRAHIKGEGN